MEAHPNPRVFKANGDGEPSPPFSFDVTGRARAPSPPIKTRPGGGPSVSTRLSPSGEGLRCNNGFNGTVLATIEGPSVAHPSPIRYHYPLPLDAEAQ